MIEAGFNVFLPQEENKKLVYASLDWTTKVFKCNMSGIDWCDIVLAIMDGATVDDGTAWECGVAYADGKYIIGLRTDIRAGGDGYYNINLMLSESANRIYSTIEEVIDHIKAVERSL